MPGRGNTPSVDFSALTWVEDPLELAGFQLHMRLLALQQDRPGFLPIGGAGIGQVFRRRLGVDAAHADSLIKRLTDSGALVWDRDGTQLYDPELVRLCQAQAERAEKNRERARRGMKEKRDQDRKFSAEHNPLCTDQVAAQVVKRNRGVTGAQQAINLDVTGAQAPPPEVSPPLYPSLPNPHPVPNASHSGIGVPPSAEAGHEAKKRAKKERKLSDEQNAVWREFTDWWTFVAWPKRHMGEVYEFKPVDGKMSIEILRDRRFFFNLEVVKWMAEEFLKEDEVNGNWDHKLTRFHQKRGWYHRLYLRRVKQGEGSNYVLRATGTDDAKPRTDPSAAPIIEF